jgi:hypothetical protein
MKKSVTLRMTFVTFCHIGTLSFWNNTMMGYLKMIVNSNDQTVWKRIEEKARDLGGVTRDEILEMGSYKLARNRGSIRGKG